MEKHLKSLLADVILTVIEDNLVTFPKDYDWLYEPDTDHTPAIAAQNKAIADKATVFSSPPLPSQTYQAILKKL